MIYVRIEFSVTTTKDRSLPVTCVQVEADGTVPPLEETFKPCPGDPDYP
jgi:hypothetical protein